MATFLFEERHPSDNLTAKAIFLPKKKIFFAKYLPENIEALAKVESVKKGFLIRPIQNLIVSVTSLHEGNKGCCRILFARKDRKKDGGKSLGFAKVAKQNLLRKLNKIGEKLSHIPTGARHALLYADEILVAESLNTPYGKVVKKTDIFKFCNPSEVETDALFAV